MISINSRDARPIYEQVRDGMRNLILSGAFAADEKLPSVRELAANLAINPNTIQRAYRELEAMGVIYTVAGKGAFASPGDAATEARKSELFAQLAKTVGELRELGVTRAELDDAVGNAFEGGNKR